MSSNLRFLCLLLHHSLKALVLFSFGCRLFFFFFGNYSNVIESVFRKTSATATFRIIPHEGPSFPKTEDALSKNGRPNAIFSAFACNQLLNPRLWESISANMHTLARDLSCVNAFKIQLQTVTLLSNQQQKSNDLQTRTNKLHRPSIQHRQPISHTFPVSLTFHFASHKENPAIEQVELFLEIILDIRSNFFVFRNTNRTWEGVGG